MLISVSYDRDKWVVDQNTALIYPEFRSVIQDKTLGVEAMAYVALGSDKSDDNPLGEVFETEEQRLAEASRCVFGGESNIPNHPKVADAVAKYLVLTDTPYSKARCDLNEALKNVGNYLKTEGQLLTKENITPYVSAMEKFPKVLLAMKELNQTHKEETIDKPNKKIKANKDLGYSAMKSIGQTG